MPTPQGILRRTTPADTGSVARPRLTPHLRVHALDEGQTLLVSETFNTLLHGKLHADLLPLLDGRRETSEIVSKIVSERASTHTREAVLSGIATLAAKGYVVCGDYRMAESEAAYWTSLGVSPSWVEAALGDARVCVEGAAGKLVAHLQAAGVRISDDAPSLKVILCKDYLEERLEAVNRQALAAKTPWMLVRPRGMTPIFGPVFTHGHGHGHGIEAPCWACLVYRMRSHAEVHNFLRNRGGEAAAFKPFAANEATLEAIYGLAAAEIAKWLVLGEDAPVHAHALSVNLGKLESARHRVTRRPQCVACGDPNLFLPDRPPVAVQLRPSPKAHLTSGGARTLAPEVTLAKYRHLVSPISGVVPWLTRTTDEGDPWLHVYWAGSNLAMKSRSLSALRRSLRSKSAGKGSTRAQSEVSALCEAIERYSGAYHGDEIRVRRRFTDFSDSEGAIHPNEVQLFSDHQLDNASAINAKGHPYNIIPNRFDPDALIDWTPVFSLSERRHRYLPTAMLYFGIAPEHEGSGGQIADSNGCAAGNTLEEAILQGFFELVERDAFAIWWYNRLRMPRVDLASFDDAFIASAEDYYAGQARELWLLDLTSDLSVPAFVALSRRAGGETEDIIYGAGAHFDPRLAALRAICELNQCLTWLPRPGARDGKPMIDDPVALAWWKTARLTECDWLAPSEDAAPSMASNYPASGRMDTREDVEQVIELLKDRGLELLVLDQTRPDIGLPVARVLVPGLRHFWQRLAPGRLYDVPVSLGRLSAPLSEGELNPSPVIA